MKQREGHFLSNWSSSEGRADRPGRSGPGPGPAQSAEPETPPSLSLFLSLSLSGHAELIIFKYCQHAIKIMSNENKEK